MKPINYILFPAISYNHGIFFKENGGGGYSHQFAPFMGDHLLSYIYPKRKTNYLWQKMKGGEEVQSFY